MSASQRLAPCTLLVSILTFLPSSCAKAFWSTSPATTSNIIKTAFPLGNGRLAALPFGPAGSESLTLNLDCLWSGGPFAAANYTGGNPSHSIASSLQNIRSFIFSNGTGNVTALLGNGDNYGSFRVLANVTVTIEGVGDGVINYNRSLDLSNGMHTTRFENGGANFATNVFCSFPDQVCVYQVESSSQLPELQVTIGNDLVEPSLQNVTCGSEYVRLRGSTHSGSPEGMQYDTIARVVSGASLETICDGRGISILKVEPGSGTKSVAIVVGAGTNYDARKGNEANGYSFRGEDPGPAVWRTTGAAASKTFATLKDEHVKDFSSLTSRFTLSLPDTQGSTNIETAQAISRYNSSSTTGDPYLESLLFNYANYLFISSSRPGSLPPNLQGRWSEGLYAAWSGDYHANINLQMNHWTPDQTGLTDLQSPLWYYMANTWVPRGRETAKLMYGAPGWIIHNEINIFGHTAMKEGAEWADNTVAAAWMMQHVFDHWEYSQDVEWVESQGYPMLRSVVEFWLHQLQEDEFTKDDTLVVNPCNSPEHGATTFGCTHFQQLIHQVLEATLTMGEIAKESDSSFLTNVSVTLDRLDKGFHIGAWGQIKEWKLPDSYGYEKMNDTHRHLSELVGWYPGYSLSSFLGGYANSTIQDAIAQKLYSRGNGNGADANAGWAKVWRSACWARLNNTAQAHFHLRYAIEQNLAPNGFSMYSGTNAPFQIDANFGIGGAVLSMLVVDLPAAFGDKGTRTVVLGPAIPAAWGGGEVRGLRLRGGGSVNFGWDGQGLVNNATVYGRGYPLRVVNKEGTVLMEV